MRRHIQLHLCHLISLSPIRSDFYTSLKKPFLEETDSLQVLSPFCPILLFL